MKKYWLYSPGENAALFDECYREGIMLLGWGELGDLNKYYSKEEIGDALVKIEDWKRKPAFIIWNFCNEVSIGDIIYARNGLTKIIARGEVISDYKFDPTRKGTFKHFREVIWTRCHYDFKDIAIFPRFTLCTLKPEIFAVLEKNTIKERTYRYTSMNENDYDIEKRFSDYNFVDWHQNDKYQIGDIVYIYSSEGHQRIKYKCIVTKINMPKPGTDESRYQLKPENKQYKSYVRFKLIQSTDSPLLTKDALQKIGFKGFLFPFVLSKEQIEYIENCFAKSNLIKYDTYETEEHEGTSERVYVNKYERSTKARNECIAKYGTKCVICGFDFEQKYGELGKDYIHVHHLKPLSTIKKDYIVNGAKDMIPVCPNCHAMIHRSKKCDEGKLDSITAIKEELKIR